MRVSLASALTRIIENFQEVGENCVPECGDGDGLFELEVWSEGRAVDFRVDDGDGDTVLGCSDWNECEPYFQSMYKRRACLPKDVCHTLVGAGVDFELLSNSLTFECRNPQLPQLLGKNLRLDQLQSYTASYDGETVGESRYWRDTSFRFGGNCEPQCQPDTESLVELFSVLTRTTSPGEKISWELGPVISSSPPQHSGEIELLDYDSGANVIYYQTMCLPKDECSAFRIATTKRELDMLDYSLTVDGTVLRDVKWATGETMNQTTYIGDCATEEICGNDESLLSVEFAVVNDHPVPGVEAGWRLSNIPTLTSGANAHLSATRLPPNLGTRVLFIYFRIYSALGNEVQDTGVPAGQWRGGVPVRARFRRCPTRWSLPP